MSKKPREIMIGRCPRRRNRSRAGGRQGFTLTELLVVMVIIGIILAFILGASVDAVRRANESATLSLIQKLDAAMSERMEALLTVDVSPNSAHITMATSYNNPSGNPSTAPSADRARVIALYDFIKAEMPDVFFPTGDTTYYPLNFAGQPYPGTSAIVGDTNNYGAYMLPLGTAIPISTGGGYNPNVDPTLTGTGIFGASYNAAAGIYKNLGYHTKGYDGVDNDINPSAPGYGFVDDWNEGVDASTVAGGNYATVIGNLANHTHKTARSEMLYAILVEGQGPLGSSFSSDDFTSREVADTDGDGLPEFIDAWGEPLQFYRWPIFYHSDIQRGFPNVGGGEPYANAYDDREQDPLDPSQFLLSPSWMLTGKNVPATLAQYFNSDPNAVLSGNGFLTAGDNRLSTSAWAFQYFFRTLVEPLSFLKDPAGRGTLWDRSNLVSSNSFSDYSLRRAYFTKFLILSSGPDTALGVGMLNVNYGSTGYIRDGSGASVPINATNVIQIENTAAAIDPNQWSSTTYLPYFDPNPGTSPQDSLATATTLYLQQNAGLDDISNQSGQSAAGSNP